MKKFLTKSQFENLALILTALILIAHFCALMTYSVNIPFADEWGGSFFYPGLQTKELNWPFIFGFHNEHRIVWTRLQIWLSYYLFNLNFNALVAINFLIYSIGACLYLRWLSRSFKASVTIVGVLFASTLAAGNHILAFQGQVHYSILFFLAAVALLVQQDRKILLSSILAICGIYSAGFGMILGCFYLGLCLVLAYIDQTERSKIIQAILIVAASLAIWFIGFPSHDNLISGLFTGEVWRFFFNLISSGLGYADYTILPGVICILLFAIIFLTLFLEMRSQSIQTKIANLGLFTICSGLLGVLFIIALGRARLGLNEAKASRYCEIVIFLIPSLFTLLQTAIRRGSLRRYSSAIVALFLILIVPPFLDEYHFAQRYYPEHVERNRIVACVRQYFHNGQPAICPIPANEDIKTHLDYAKEIGVLFATVN